MSEFTEILGNSKNIEHLSDAFTRGKLSHAYIINGPAGSGKKTLVNYISAGILCEQMHDDSPSGQQDLFSAFGMSAPKKRTLSDGPCRSCSACAKTASDNHPDIIRLKREKEKVISVKDIRQQIIADMAIKPYYGTYKIYIIENAQLMNENAQNALLKTIEEPPEYGIIFLLTENADALLDTIRSRCIRLDMARLTREDVTGQLVRRYDMPVSKAEAFAAFSGGNLGKALHMAEADEESEFVNSIVALLKKLERMNAADIFDEAVRIGKDDHEYALEIMQMWFRDMLFVKSEGEACRSEVLFFPSQKGTLEKGALKVTFEGINNIFTAIDTARERIEYNVKAEAALENLLLAIRKSLKGSGNTGIR